MSGRSKKVFVGLSGGVDSSVSAALLQQAGHDVTAVFIRIALPGYPCTAGEDRREALRAATHLDIPFIDIDLSDAYKEAVFQPAIREFGRGRTPNPDALCNREIKFGLFYRFAMDHGAEYVATGHYAQVKSTDTHTHLYTGNDANKDQSYFLWAVPEEQLSNTLFPVGNLEKPRVRELAEHFGLPNAARKDSQGLCFLGDIGIDDMLTKELPSSDGVVVNEAGESIGTHHGALRYTLGQRHGFTIAAQSPGSAAHYVVAKDIAHNTITVSDCQTPKGSATTVRLIEDNWIGEVQDGTYSARFRYRAQLIPATLSRKEGTTTVVLTGAHLVPEGQSLVLYDNDRCLGGGIIDEVTLEK